MIVRVLSLGGKGLIAPLLRPVVPRRSILPKEHSHSGLLPPLPPPSPTHTHSASNRVVPIVHLFPQATVSVKFRSRVLCQF